MYIYIYMHICIHIRMYCNTAVSRAIVSTRSAAPLGAVAVVEVAVGAVTICKVCSRSFSSDQPFSLHPPFLGLHGYDPNSEPREICTLSARTFRAPTPLSGLLVLWYAQSTY